MPPARHQLPHQKLSGDKITNNPKGHSSPALEQIHLLEQACLSWPRQVCASDGGFSKERETLFSAFTHKGTNSATMSLQSSLCRVCQLGEQDLGHSTDQHVLYTSETEG